MFSFLPGPFTYFIAATLMFFNTMFVGSFVLICGIIKMCMFHPKVRLKMANLSTKGLATWGYFNGLTFKAISKANIRIEGLEHLKSDKGYFLMSNHLSGFDIAILGYIFRSCIPTPKYFLKRELLFIPFLGLACWALDMPFVRRYSAKQLRKKPHLRGADILSTQKACKKFKDIPTSIINFVEGTRINETKRINQKSPYKHLLKPKANGMALTLSTLGGQFEKILNITIIYPQTQFHSDKVLNAVLLGKVQDVIIHIEQLDVPQINYAEYKNNKELRVGFQRWLNKIWQQKDQLIEQELQHYFAEKKTIQTTQHPKKYNPCS